MSQMPQGLYYDKLASQGKVAGPVNPSSGFKQYTPPAVLGAATAAPQTGGQAFSGGGGGAGIPLVAPNTSYQGPNPDDVTNQLKAQYSQAANDIQAQNPLLDQSYNQAKTDIGNELSTTQAQSDQQKQNLNNSFGDVLRNELQSYRDLGKQRQGAFSSLGSLDSSAYQDQQFKADQNYSDQLATTNRDKEQQTNAVDTAMTSYANQAQSQLAQLATQYQQGKNAISSALAQNNLQQASAISAALDQLRTRAQSVQDTMINFANQAAQLKALGYGVRQQIGGYNGSPFIQDATGYLNGNQQTAQQYAPGQAPAPQAGYIGSSPFQKQLLPGQPGF